MGDIVTQRHYVSEVKNIAKRHVLRLDPATKSRLCKKCNSILKTGIFRVKKKKSIMKRVCPFCFTTDKRDPYKQVIIIDKEIN